jgi:hypothetical protein
MFLRNPADGTGDFPRHDERQLATIAQASSATTFYLQRVLKRGLTLCGRDFATGKTPYWLLSSVIKIGSKEGQTPF